MISTLGFRNPEDLIYLLTQNFFPYMNYGMFPPIDSKDYSGYSEEEINYLELFGLCPSVTSYFRNILEIGCGLGHGAQLVLKEIQPEGIIAIDRSRSAIKYAQKHFVETRITYINQDFSDHVSIQNHFDLIYTVESGGLFPKQEHFDIAYRLLKNGGIFLVANINPLSEIVKKRQFAERSGFLLHMEKDVTSQVVAYLWSNKKSEMFYSVIHSMPFSIALICRIFLKSIKEVTRMPGSKSLALLGDREFYYHFCFVKP
jgi:SAM-dependent methyltransferase